ncbi:hypothetical protein VTI28DRAFT_5755 [Corynascus sepedonium]
MREARPTRPERATPVRKPRRPPASQDQVGEGRDQPPRRVSRHRTRMASSWATHLYCPVLPLPCLFHSFLQERDGPPETHVTAGMRDTSTWQLDVGRAPSTSHPEDRGIGFQVVHHAGIMRIWLVVRERSPVPSRYSLTSPWPGFGPGPTPR